MVFTHSIYLFSTTILPLLLIIISYLCIGIKPSQIGVADLTCLLAEEDPLDVALVLVFNSEAASLLIRNINSNCGLQNTVAVSNTTLCSTKTAVCATNTTLMLCSLMSNNSLVVGIFSAHTSCRYS